VNKELRRKKNVKSMSSDDVTHTPNAKRAKIRKWQTSCRHIRCCDEKCSDIVHTKSLCHHLSDDNTTILILHFLIKITHKAAESRASVPSQKKK
jgi:hypothetical protein